MPTDLSQDISRKYYLSDQSMNYVQRAYRQFSQPTQAVSSLHDKQQHGGTATAETTNEQYE